MPNDETLHHPDQPRFLFGTWVWAVILFVFFGAIVAITFGAIHRGSTYEAERAQTRTEKLKTAREEWDKASNGYAWVDQAKGVARIPIQRAIELEVTDLQAKKPAPAGPIATPEPAAVPVTATGAGQPVNPPAAAPAPTVATPTPSSVTGVDSQIRGQPTGAANPRNAPAGTQPGANATPAAAPQTQSSVAPVSPTVTPVQHPVGTPIPVRGTSPAPTP